MQKKETQIKKVTMITFFRKIRRAFKSPQEHYNDYEAWLENWKENIYEWNLLWQKSGKTIFTSKWSIFRL